VKKNFIAPVALAAAGLLLLSACAGGAEEAATDTSTTTTTETESGEAALSGTIQLDGSSTVGPFAEAAAELFMDVNPGVRVTVGISGTGGGFEKFCNGETDGSNASRLIKDEEADLCASNGIEFGTITVANDALSVVVNQENPLECISVEALKAVWEFGSTVRTWGDIPGVDAGALAGQAIDLYGPGVDSGTFDFFTEEINEEGGNITASYTDIGEDDNQAVQGVSGSVGGMAFIPYSFYQEYSDTVKGLAIDNGNGCVDPTVENLIAGNYTPLGRGLYMFPSAAALERPEVVAFYEFVINSNAEIAAAAGLVSLTDAQKTEQLAVVAGLG
jgi:phosphate transport system substrate-binding protein